MADGGDDLIAGDDELGALHGHRTAPPGGVWLAQRHALHLDAGHLVRGMAVKTVGDDPHGCAQQLKLDALFLGLVDLAFVGGHLLARPAVQTGHLPGAPAHCGATGVHGGEAAADDDDPLAHVHIAIALQVPEETSSGDDPVRVLAWDAQGVAAAGAQRQEDGVVVLEQALELIVDAEPDARLQLDAHAPQDIDLLVEDLARQTIAGDAVAQHAARFGHRLEDRDCMSLEPGVEGSGEARRPAAHDRQALA